MIFPNFYFFIQTIQENLKIVKCIKTLKLVAVLFCKKRSDGAENRSQNSNSKSNSMSNSSKSAAGLWNPWQQLWALRMMGSVAYASEQ